MGGRRVGPGTGVALGQRADHCPKATLTSSADANTIGIDEPGQTRLKRICRKDTGMTDLANRLRKGAAALESFDRKRVENAMTPEDLDEEYRIILTELWGLEEDIFRDPGALAARLVPIRRIRKGAK
jgi:hypothetical protein